MFMGKWLQNPKIENKNIEYVIQGAVFNQRDKYKTDIILNPQRLHHDAK